MAAIIKSVTFDCLDALVLARFWAAALGTDVDEDATSDVPGWDRLPVLPLHWSIMTSCQEWRMDNVFPINVKE